MAVYLPPKNPKNQRFNVLDFKNNNLDYSAYDERYIKLFGQNNILSVNNFFGISTFFNNINSFMYASVFKVLSSAKSIITPLFISEQIQTTQLEVKLINGIPYHSVGVFLNLFNIQYPLIKSIENTLNIFGTSVFTSEQTQCSVILYPDYTIQFYGERNLLLSKISNETTNIKFSLVELKYNLPCLKIIICYKNKKIL
jgi:hypothetical protein